MQVLFCNILFLFNIFFSYSMTMYYLIFFCCLIVGYLDHLKLFSSKNSVPWNILMAGSIGCFSLRDNPKQTELCTQWIFMKWINEWLNIAVDTNVVFACTHVRTSFEVHDQKGNCWVLKLIGLLISLCNDKFTLWCMRVICLSRNNTILSDVKILPVF